MTIEKGWEERGDGCRKRDPYGDMAMNCQREGKGMEMRQLIARVPVRIPFTASVSSPLTRLPGSRG